MGHFTSFYKNQPESVQRYIRMIIDFYSPEKIVLFGSRARGDHRENSDYDLAVFGDVDFKKWAQLQSLLEESNLTLYSFDVVLYADIGSEYKKNIDNEGKLLYERL